jgi:uncharacterized protein YkwD
MTRKPFLKLGPLGVAVAALALAAPAARAQSPAQLEQAMAQSVNQFRAQNGKPALTVNAALTRSAQKYAQKLAQLDTTVGGPALHTVGGGTPMSRAQQEGYTAIVGENAAWNQGYADAVAKAMADWVNEGPSGGHYKNLLGISEPGADRAYFEFGVGAAKSASGRWYFVIDFGTGRPSSPLSPSHFQAPLPPWWQHWHGFQPKTPQ